MGKIMFLITFFRRETPFRTPDWEWGSGVRLPPDPCAVNDLLTHCLTTAFSESSTHKERNRSKEKRADGAAQSLPETTSDSPSPGLPEFRREGGF